MPDIWCDVDTSVIIPVNILPLLDDTDFKSIETAVVYNSAGIAVTWNFVTTAGVVTGVAITPTTGGVYDWSEPIADKGMYAIEIPNTGGVSANNDTEGFGWITGVATGVLPWRGPTIGFRKASMNNVMVDNGTLQDNLEDMFDGTGYAGGTAKLGVDVVAISGDTTAADNAELMFDGTGYAGGTAKLGVDVVSISGDTTAADNAELMFDGTGYAGGTTKLGVNLVAILGTAITETVGGYLSAGFKKLLDVAAPVFTLASLNQTGDSFVRIGANGASLSAVPWNASWDAEVQSEVDDALVAQRLDELLNADSDIDGAAPPTVGSVFHELLTKTPGSFTYDQATDSLEAVRDNLGTAVGASLSADIADLPTVAEFEARTLVAANYFDPAVDTVSVSNITSAGVVDILTEPIANGEAGASGRTLLGAIAKLVNKVAIAAGVLTVYKTDDATSLFTQAVTTDAAADPIISVDTA